MNENINLCKILKGHEGETFWNPLVGNIIYKSGEGGLVFFQYGKSVIDIPYHGKDMNNNMSVFPSKDQRDWEVWDKENNQKHPKTWSELEKFKNWHMYGIEHHYKDDIYLSYEGESPIEKSALALLKIHHLIEVGYGGNVTNEEWRNDDWKYTIGYFVKDDEFSIQHLIHDKLLIAFRTRKQAEKFLSYPENVQLLRDYYQIN